MAEQIRFEMYQGTSDGLRIRFKINGSVYTMGENDKLVLNVSSCVGATKILHKETTTDTISFLPSDTVSIDPGTYVFDVTLIKNSGSEIIKIIDPESRFIIKGVVGNG